MGIADQMTCKLLRTDGMQEQIAWSFDVAIPIDADPAQRRSAEKTLIGFLPPERRSGCRPAAKNYVRPSLGLPCHSIGGDRHMRLTCLIPFETGPRLPNPHDQGAVPQLPDPLPGDAAQKFLSGIDRPRLM